MCAGVHVIMGDDVIRAGKGTTNAAMVTKATFVSKVSVISI
jgi:hypothetical protein